MVAPLFPPLIDTHAHLCDPVFDADRKTVIQRAESAGLSRIVSVGENLADGKRTLALARKYPQIAPCAGLYPGNSNLVEAQSLFAFIEAHQQELVGIGEVGLDFWLAKEEAERELQRHIFSDFIKLSQELDLPLNIHSRSAGRHAIQMLLQQDAQKVHLHAFDGKWGTAMAAVEAGYFFSIPPSVVRSKQKLKLVRQLPLENILLETDAPVLGASPDERNEPANLPIVLGAIAEIKNIPAQMVAEYASQNTHDLYGLASASGPCPK